MFYSLVLIFSYVENSLPLPNVIVFTNSSEKSFSASMITETTTVAVLSATLIAIYKWDFLSARVTK